MKKTLFIVAMLVLIASAANASIWSSYLYGWDGITSSTKAVSLDANVFFSSGLYTYEFTLTNDAGSLGDSYDYSKPLDGFTIDFTGANSGGLVVDASTPIGWIYTFDATEDTLNWDTTTAKIAPGASALFRFTSPFAPGAIVAASAQDGIGFSGVTVAPVPEPISMILGAMGLAAVGGFKRFKK